MGFILFCLIIIAAFGDSSNNKRYKKQKKSYRHSRNSQWLDYAWFHDHGQKI